ncbi:hypothetical protein ACG33_03415 [Steroidobacter denitrificans]|uniref:FAS1-like dehydratase domain-containing protein n=2 Tax=Steroidobacter denitrificans TaxID=465721 RepID=A0A127F6Z0_STEDE|nr:hypothetical protein ACG33_03415 [Steroidobacter denitrificans]
MEIEKMALDIAEVNALVGKESALRAARHAANIPDIRHWCEVIQQDNRSYKEFEKNTVHAPAALLMVWTMPPLWSPESAAATEPHERAIKLLEDAGYGTGLAVALEQKFLRPLKVGERLSYRVKLSGVSSGEVETGIGRGYQLDLLYTFQNQDGDVVSEQLCRRAQVARITVPAKH